MRKLFRCFAVINHQRVKIVFIRFEAEAFLIVSSGARTCGQYARIFNRLEVLNPFVLKRESTALSTGASRTHQELWVGQTTSNT